MPSAMDPERLHDLVIQNATIGLEEADRNAYAAWLAEASPAEKEEVAEWYDALAAVTLAMPNRDGVRCFDQQRRHRVRARLLNHLYAETADTRNWRSLPIHGASMNEIAYSRQRETVAFLLKLQADTRFPSHSHRGSEETVILQGTLQVNDQFLQEGDYLRVDENTDHRDIYSKEGCLALVITHKRNYPRIRIRAYDFAYRGWQRMRRIIRPS